jgi:AraC-like DNA-binding protein
MRGGMNERREAIHWRAMNEVDPELAELARLGDELARGEPRSVMTMLASVAGFSSRERIYLGEFVHTRSLLAALLEGRKEIVFRGERTIAERGDLVIIPAGVRCELVSTPDGETHRFRSLCVDLDPEIGARLAREHPSLCVSPALGALDPTRPHVIYADRPALQALLHFGRTLLVPGVHSALVSHRVGDLLLALSLQRTHEPAVDGDVVLAIRSLVRSDPQAAWSAPEIARKVALSPATLRRRLSELGLTLRDIRTEERMALAASLLSAQGARVSEVALRCGYRSPSKFARQYKRWCSAQE